MAKLDVLFILDPIAAIQPATDSSYVMVTEALRRGHRPYAVELEGLALLGERAIAHAMPIALMGAAQSPLTTRSLTPSEPRELNSFAAVLMRKDPPLDDNYLVATWCMDRARGQTLLVNDPRGLRDLNEKLSILAFPDLIPETRLLRRSEDLRQALDDFGGHMIVKPVFGFGGSEIFRADKNDPNLSTIFEVATHNESRWTLAQAYLKEATEGDKRILLVDGEAIGGVLRVPATGELRNNFHAGGSARLTELSARDLEICAQVGPYLRDHGQFFAGIDVIGGHLTEINVTSPTGMQEINRLRDLHEDRTMQAQFWDALETKCAKPTNPPLIARDAMVPPAHGQ